MLLCFWLWYSQFFLYYKALRFPQTFTLHLKFWYKFIVLRTFDNNAVILHRQCKFNYPHLPVWWWLYFIHMFKWSLLRLVSMCLHRQNPWTKREISIWKGFCCSLRAIWEGWEFQSHQPDDDYRKLHHKLHFFVCTNEVWSFFLRWLFDQGILLNCQFNCRIEFVFEYQLGIKSFSQTILYKNLTEFNKRSYNVTGFAFDKIKH